MIEEGLYDLISSDPDVAALIDTRIHALSLPADPTTPAVTVRLISTTEDYTLDGANGMVQVRLQIDSYADEYAVSQATARVIRKALNGYTGTLPNGCVVLNVTRDGEQTGFDEYARLFYTQTDWLVTYSD